MGLGFGVPCLAFWREVPNSRSGNPKLAIELHMPVDFINTQRTQLARAPGHSLTRTFWAKVQTSLKLQAL